MNFNQYIDEATGFVNVPIRYCKGNKMPVILSVEGNRAKVMGIHDGDQIVVDISRKSARKGVVLIKEKGKFRLAPATERNNVYGVVTYILPRARKTSPKSCHRRM